MNRLTPLEIQRASFPRRLLGLDPKAVHELLSALAEMVEEDSRVRGELKAHVARLTREVDEYRLRADALNDALLTAQKSAEATVAKAEADGQRIVTEAQALADRILEEATRRAENVEVLISQLRARRRAARGELRRLMEVLDGVARDDEASEQRDADGPTVAVLRPRQQKEGKGER